VLGTATLVDFIRLNAKRHPDRCAVVDDTARLTHSALSARALALARGLQATGVKPGDHVGILGGNTIFTIESFLGVIAAGAVAVMYNWRWATAELVHGISSTKAGVVLVEDRFRNAFADAVDSGSLASVKAWHQKSGYESLFTHGSAVGTTVGSDDPMCILFTGGTTGFSKGVVLPHRSAIVNSLNEIVDTGLAQGDNNVALNVTPLFHSASLLCVFAPHYVTGGTNVLLGNFDEDRVGAVVEREQVTNTFMIPNMIRRLLRAGTFETPGFQKQFQQLHTGGGLLRMPDKLAVAAVAPNINMFFRYGLTEAGPMVTRALTKDVMNPALDGTIGQEYTFAEVRVENLDGHEANPGELGEICVRGPALMLGYFERPKETRLALREGWLHTGDLAVRDENGYLFFRDRAKDMIKSGGENVYAAEIEQQLYTHPAVMECGVLGVASSEWDEEVRAVVALRPGAEVSEDELKTYLRQSLAGYKIPKLIKFIQPEQMPVNPSGKIVKSRLREVVHW